MMRRASTFLGLFVLTAACAPSHGAGPSPSPSPGAKDVVAEVDGVAITREELDRKAAAELARIHEQEYEARRNALDDLINERLVAKEALARGISKEDLLAKEIEQKLTRPTEAEIDRVYAQNRGRIGDRSRDQVAPQIVQSILRDRAGERAQAFLKELRAKAKVKVAMQQPRTEVPVASEAKTLGPAGAKVTIVEYSDYLCPYCRQAQGVVDQVLERYEGKVRFVHRDFLLGRPRSLAVARAALCAGDQGRFWEYRHDLLMKDGDWSDEDLKRRAGPLGLKGDEFAACLASERHDAEVQRSSQEGQGLGVSGTPTFFINGRRMTGVRSAEQFQEVIDEELKGS